MKRNPGDHFEKDGLFYYVENYRQAVLYDCESDAETITVPDTADGFRVTMKYRVFEDMPNLRHLIFEPGVWIRNRVLDWWSGFRPVKDCPKLETVTLPDWFEAKGELLPDGCPAFKGYIAGPENENYLSDDGCLYLKKEDGTLELVCCARKEKTVRIPDEVNGRKVTSVDSSAFFSGPETDEIILPEGLTELSGVFCGNRTVYLPDGFDDLDGYTVWGPSTGALRFRVSDSHPAYLEEDGFIYDRSGEKLIFAPRDREVCRVKEGVRVIGRCAFASQQSLKEVFLPESLEKIEAWAFEDCGWLCDVHFPKGADAVCVEDGAFEFCLFSLPKEMMRRAREEVAAMTDKEQDELSARCIDLAEQLGLT
ncbi:MAG: leucine-rich repeat protein [Oscillospiraceae bacterium]|nr:leucine-rich repeat protein [Oscillospiraceae bacterium]